MRAMTPPEPRSANQRKNFCFMKRLLFLVATFSFPALALQAFAANIHHDNGNSSSPAAASHESLSVEVKYALDMAHRVQHEANAYGSNLRLREEMKHVDAEIFHVNDEFAAHNYDPGHIHAEVVRIDDELHQMDMQLRDLEAHDPGSLNGMMRVR